jgi:hypothetical protein
LKSEKGEVFVNVKEFTLEVRESGKEKNKLQIFLYAFSERPDIQSLGSSGFSIQIMINGESRFLNEPEVIRFARIIADYTLPTLFVCGAFDIIFHGGITSYRLKMDGDITERDVLGKNIRRDGGNSFVPGAEFPGASFTAKEGIYMLMSFMAVIRRIISPVGLPPADGQGREEKGNDGGRLFRENTGFENSGLRVTRILEKNGREYVICGCKWGIVEFYFEAKTGRMIDLLIYKGIGAPSGSAGMLLSAVFAHIMDIFPAVGYFEMAGVCIDSIELWKIIRSRLATLRCDRARVDDRKIIFGKAMKAGLSGYVEEMKTPLPAIPNEQWRDAARLARAKDISGIKDLISVLGISAEDIHDGGSGPVAVYRDGMRISEQNVSYLRPAGEGLYIYRAAADDGRGVLTFEVSVSKDRQGRNTCALEQIFMHKERWVKRGFGRKIFAFALEEILYNPRFHAFERIDEMSTSGICTKEPGLGETIKRWFSLGFDRIELSYAGMEYEGEIGRQVRLKRILPDGDARRYLNEEVLVVSHPLLPGKDFLDAEISLSQTGNLREMAELLASYFGRDADRRTPDFGVFSGRILEQLKTVYQVTDRQLKPLMWVFDHIQYSNAGGFLNYYDPEQNGYLFLLFAVKEGYSLEHALLSVISGILNNYNVVPSIAPKPAGTIELITSSPGFTRFLGLCGIDVSKLILLIRSTETPLPACTSEIIKRKLENYDTKEAAILSDMIGYLRHINNLPAYAPKYCADYPAECRKNDGGLQELMIRREKELREEIRRLYGRALRVDSEPEHADWAHIAEIQLEYGKVLFQLAGLRWKSHRLNVPKKGLPRIFILPPAAESLVAVLDAVEKPARIKLRIYA